MRVQLPPERAGDAVGRGERQFVVDVNLHVGVESVAHPPGFGVDDAFDAWHMLGCMADLRRNAWLYPIEGARDHRPGRLPNIPKIARVMRRPIIGSARG